MGKRWSGRAREDCVERGWRKGQYHYKCYLQLELDVYCLLLHFPRQRTSCLMTSTGRLCTLWKQSRWDRYRIAIFADWSATTKKWTRPDILMMSLWCTYMRISTSVSHIDRCEWSRNYCVNEVVFYHYLQSLSSTVVATWLLTSSSSMSILTVTDLGGARFACEAWQSIFW